MTLDKFASLYVLCEMLRVCISRCERAVKLIITTRNVKPLPTNLVWLYCEVSQIIITSGSRMTAIKIWGVS